MARRNDHTRGQIREMALQAAETIVSTEGLSGLSARKISRDMGYTVGTLYLVFRNLDELVLALNARTLDELHRRMTDAAARSSEPLERVGGLAQAYLGFAQDHRHRWEMIYEHRLPEGEPLPDWYRDKIARVFALVEQALAPLADRYEPAHITQAARALWGGVHGICILALTGKLDVAGEARAPALVDSLVRNYLRGLGQ
ncbi:MAG: TetR/AcrR family transcriptional regulator [Gammaproteobacteria bacterium]|nr:TetR/AcrR family transcriptional regulator [Gammaproteobacteria bacterium]NIR58684.1 TetR/AcrR family transcriptional regulator [Gammaproteobacteria bacterium]NIR90344.1 TetR/AcrR family transcriptional regulator [Gammaproteobacteria bacterium]